MLDVLW